MTLGVYVVAVRLLSVSLSLQLLQTDQSLLLSSQYLPVIDSNPLPNTFLQEGNMRPNALYPVLTACLLGSITGVTGVALPDGRPGFSLARRQDDPTQAGEVETETTKDLRECK